jgi:uncharacterized protein YfaT (DUF1175 family)
MSRRTHTAAPRWPLGLSLAMTMAIAGAAAAQVQFEDASDREAFRRWVVILADAQFTRPTPDVNDCAALVRHAVREALRTSRPDWRRRIDLPDSSAIAPAVRARVTVDAGTLAMFRVSAGSPPRFGEFADARTLVMLNSRPLGRDLQALRPGDLIYFRQEGQALPDHLMLFVGRSSFEEDGDDWVVYHTGPSGPDGEVLPGGEVRKARLADLTRHPALRWRPVPSNPAFVGVYRLVLMGS